MSSATSSVSDDDSFFLLMFATTWGLPAVIAYFTRDRLFGWLLEHQLLLPAAVDPTVAVPGADGAGLDVARLALALGLLAGLLVASGSSLRRRRGGHDEKTEARR